MNIKPVSNNFSYNKELENKKAKDSANESKIEDKLEISDQAKVLNKENLQSKKMAVVKERIDNNFYNSDQVLKKVSEEIYKELKG
jgi:hypothetical protein